MDMQRANDCIDKELLKLMEKAGCTGIFFGIETGSARMQQTIGKKLDLDQAAEAIRCAESLQVRSTVSMIIGFPGGDAGRSSEYREFSNRLFAFR